MLSARAHKVKNLVLVLLRSKNGFVLVLIGVKIYLVQSPIVDDTEIAHRSVHMAS